MEVSAYILNSIPSNKTNPLLGLCALCLSSKGTGLKSTYAVHSPCLSLGTQNLRAQRAAQRSLRSRAFELCSVRVSQPFSEVKERDGSIFTY